ncbi:hypothetical protein B0H15DRAFT_793929 [Mycena belliarum]|uniref:CCHC-type domain-containing protein n=1 Tax=Mycena belliarum TaxID=1033014 RepID=A0AAD6TLS1_9AGAR|nr:hypothetical protein B0H15DRAFT_793929 [Mycena belliae]
MNNIPSTFLLPENDRFSNRDDQSYTHWCGLVVDSATARGLLGYLDGTTPKPTSNPIQAIYVPTPWFSKTPFDEEWVQREATAHGLLFGNLVNPIALGLDRTDTTAATWTKLDAIFGTTTSLALVEVQRKLRGTFWDGTSPIKDHIELMRTFWAAANEAGAKIDDTTFTDIFVTSLPHTWDAVLPILDTLKGSGAVIAHCQRHYARITTTKSDISSPSAGGVQALANTVIRCTNCKKSGHVTSNCFQPGGGKAGQYPDWYKGKRVYTPGTAPPARTAAPVAAAAQNTVFTAAAATTGTPAVKRKISSLRGTWK